MNKPTKSQWGAIEKNNLDAETAFKNFIGKSFSEAEEMFKENAYYYQEDLISMPAVAFNYYAPAYANYVVSKSSKDDPDGASCFLHMVIELLKSNRHLATYETLEVLLQAAKRVSERQHFYDADVSIYGEFGSLYKKIVQLYSCT